MPTQPPTAAIHLLAVQAKIAPTRDSNLESFERLLGLELSAGPVDLVVLPELHNHPYFCVTENPDAFDLAEPIPGPTTERLAALAASHQVVLVSSLFERRAPGVYHNTAVVFERDGSIAGRYRKMHIPDDPGYYEKYYFTPGDVDSSPYEPIRTSAGALGVMVCWDQWYPEAARLMSLGGADLLLYPTAIGFDPADTPAEQQRQLDAWKTVQRGHAIANGLPLVAVNRCGHEPDPSGATGGARFWGHSFVCGPQGEALWDADDEPTSARVTVDLRRSEAVRRTWPFLRDRRVDSYGGLTRRWRD